MRTNLVKQAVAAFADRAGWKRRGSAWYKLCDEIIVVMDVQKSNYGRQYYLNLGFWIRQLGSENAYPSSNQCHIVSRVEALIPDARDEIMALLDLEQPLADDVRAQRLAALLTEKIEPLTRRGCTLLGLREMKADGTLSASGITGSAVQLLNGYAL